MQFHLLFPAFSDALREPDPQFQREWEAAEDLGIGWRVFGFDTLLEGNLERSFKFLPAGHGETLLYRGWILKEREYRLLGSELGRRGYRLHASAAAFARTNYLPNYHSLIWDRTPPAVWTRRPDPQEAWRLAQEMGPPPYIIKDHVKSAKELWEEACYVPAGATERKFIEMCRRLRDFRGDRFEKGFVVRPYVPLRFLDENPFGGRIFEEYRLFFFHGMLLSASPYDRVGGAVANFEAFLDLPTVIRSPFFSADIGRTEIGELILIELGDGGVSQLPPTLKARQFYQDVLAIRAARAKAR